MPGKLARPWGVTTLQSWLKPRKGGGDERWSDPGPATRFLRKAWIPLILVVVLAVAALVVSRLPKIFGSGDLNANAGAGSEIVQFSANIIAQSDGSQIGCRITVDNVVQEEKRSDGVNPQTFCLMKSA